MSVLAWIIISGLAMSCIALIGSLILIFKEPIIRRLLSLLVAFAAGSLIGGALLHMIPAGLEVYGNSTGFFLWILAGFASFLALEQMIHWHHCKNADAQCKRPLGYMILIGDALHNLIGGLAVAGTFLVDIRLGITTWLAAALHEIPQELGDFGVLLHAGWSRKSALLFNFFSALTFLVGGLITYNLSSTLNTSFLVPFAAGNFLYIGASDLVPEVNKHRDVKENVVHFLAFIISIGMMWLLKVMNHH